MKLKTQYVTVFLLVGSLFLSCISFGTTTSTPTEQPLSINYKLSKVEKLLEKNYDKQYKIDWDFDIVYHDSKVFVIMEYEKGYDKKFKKVSPENLHKFISDIITQINKSLKQDIEIHGIIRPDDTDKATYSFEYKNGNLDIK